VWRFPAETSEIRYYLQGNGFTDLIGGDLDATGSNPSGSIDQELFNQIVAMFQMAP
jgi:hypothetical protein